MGGECNPGLIKSGWEEVERVPPQTWLGRCISSESKGLTVQKATNFASFPTYLGHNPTIPEGRSLNYVSLRPSQSSLPNYSGQPAPSEDKNPVQGRLPFPLTSRDPPVREPKSDPSLWTRPAAPVPQANSGNLPLPWPQNSISVKILPYISVAPLTVMPGIV